MSENTEAFEGDTTLTQVEIHDIKIDNHISIRCNTLLNKKGCISFLKIKNNFDKDIKIEKETCLFQSSSTIHNWFAV